MTTTHKLRIYRSLGWLMVVAVAVLSLIRLPQAPASIAGGDKLLHLGTYFFLSYWFFHVYQNKKWPITTGFALMGTLLEWLQSLTDYRYFEWLDWGMNLAGVMLAWLGFYVLQIKVKALKA